MSVLELVEFFNHVAIQRSLLLLPELVNGVSLPIAGMLVASGLGFVSVARVVACRFRQGLALGISVLVGGAYWSWVILAFTIGPLLMDLRGWGLSPDFSMALCFAVPAGVFGVFVLALRILAARPSISTRQYRFWAGASGFLWILGSILWSVHVVDTTRGLYFDPVAPRQISTTALAEPSWRWRPVVLQIAEDSLSLYDEVIQETGVLPHGLGEWIMSYDQNPTRRVSLDVPFDVSWDRTRQVIRFLHAELPRCDLSFRVRLTAPRFDPWMLLIFGHNPEPVPGLLPFEVSDAIDPGVVRVTIGEGTKGRITYRVNEEFVPDLAAVSLSIERTSIRTVRVEAVPCIRHGDIIATIDAIREGGALTIRVLTSSQ